MRVNIDPKSRPDEVSAELRRIRTEHSHGFVEVWRGALKICHFVTQSFRDYREGSDYETRFCFITTDAVGQRLVALPWRSY